MFTELVIASVYVYRYKRRKQSLGLVLASNGHLPPVPHSTSKHDALYTLAELQHNYIAPLIGRVRSVGATLFVEPRGSGRCDTIYPA